MMFESTLAMIFYIRTAVKTLLCMEKNQRNMFAENRKPKRDVVSSNLFELAVALLELPRRRNFLAEA